VEYEAERITPSDFSTPETCHRLAERLAVPQFRSYALCESGRKIPTHYALSTNDRSRARRIPGGYKVVDGCHFRGGRFAGHQKHDGPRLTPSNTVFGIALGNLLAQQPLAFRDKHDSRTVRLACDRLLCQMPKNDQNGGTLRRVRPQ